MSGALFLIDNHKKGNAKKQQLTTAGVSPANKPYKIPLSHKVKR